MKNSLSFNEVNFMLQYQIAPAGMNFLPFFWFYIYNLTKSTQIQSVLKGDWKVITVYNMYSILYNKSVG